MFFENLYNPEDALKMRESAAKLFTKEGWDTPSYLKDILADNGVKVDSIELQQDSLRDLYPNLTINGTLTPRFHYVSKEEIMKKRYKVEHTPTKVIFNPPATIIFWTDDTKTVVKCGENDEFDPEKGLAMAFAKKKLGNKGNYYNTIRYLLENAEYQYESESTDPELLQPWQKMIFNAITGRKREIPRVVIKKMRGKHYDQVYFTCPECEDEILKSGARYCANCGQRLIWEEK